jgi:Domain of unknown function (DUF1707)/Cell wall-active antibiotics response 4TMS YvqF
LSEPDDSLRVSDAERDAVLHTLGEHAAVGRLTLDELEDRSGRALAARTRGDLAPLTSDLPQEAGQSGAPAPAPSRRQPVRWMVAVMSASRRRGRFRAVGSINAVAVMGGNEIDLREAELEGGELTLNLFAFMGGTEVYVPDSVELDVGGFSFMGGHEEIGSERLPRPGAPLIRIRAYNFMGGASICYEPNSALTPSSRTGRRPANRSSAESAASSITAASELGEPSVTPCVSVTNGAYRTFTTTRTAGRGSAVRSAASSPAIRLTSA